MEAGVFQLVANSKLAVSQTVKCAQPSGSRSSRHLCAPNLLCRSREPRVILLPRRYSSIPLNAHGATTHTHTHTLTYYNHDTIKRQDDCASRPGVVPAMRQHYQAFQVHTEEKASPTKEKTWSVPEISLAFLCNICMMICLISVHNAACWCRDRMAEEESYQALNGQANYTRFCTIHVRVTRC
jgi:hypothetical protein